MIDTELARWLLDSDPALRWQVERDLLDEPEEVWQATRARVATEGFGAAVLAQQDDDGQWAGGAFFPAGWEGRSGDPQPWTATTWALKDLREWGVDADVLGDTASRLEAARWEYDDLPYWGGEVDCCINSWTLSNGLWLGADVDGIVEWMLAHQLDDGGWNCAWVEGATVSSFPSTLNILVGLLDYQLATGDDERVRAARRAGEEYLLRRNLFRRLSTGEPVGDWARRWTSPRRWQYSDLAAADHLRAASIADHTAPDPRMSEAIEHIRSQRQADGTWRQGHRPTGDVWVQTDVPDGEPSRWLTLQATRVLQWWDTGGSGA